MSVSTLIPVTTVPVTRVVRQCDYRPVVGRGAEGRDPDRLSAPSVLSLNKFHHSQSSPPLLFPDRFLRLQDPSLARDGLSERVARDEKSGTNRVDHLLPHPDPPGSRKGNLSAPKQPSLESKCDNSRGTRDMGEVPS